jgi:hypothetical protein
MWMANQAPEKLYRANIYLFSDGDQVALERYREPTNPFPDDVGN